MYISNTSIKKKKKVQAVRKPRLDVQDVGKRQREDAVHEERDWRLLHGMIDWYGSSVKV